jgi:hypothetical protein
MWWWSWIKCNLVITWALFMCFNIACREIIYARFQSLCIIYLTTNIKNGILQIIFFFLLAEPSVLSIKPIFFSLPFAALMVWPAKWGGKVHCFVVLFHPSTPTHAHTDLITQHHTSVHLRNMEAQPYVLHTLLFVWGRQRWPTTLYMYFICPVHKFEKQIFSTGNYDNADCNIT